VADIVDPEARSAMMGRIRSSNTQPELMVRRVVHRLGYRFRCGGAGLPGRPDMVLPRLDTVIMVHGCFWHRHPGCDLSTTPRTNASFWAAKFADNVARDARVEASLRDRGWKVVTVWECELGNPSKLERRLAGILRRRDQHVARPDRRPGR
jgi:DNA mismatch endonuclease, patch repair protein